MNNAKPDNWTAQQCLERADKEWQKISAPAEVTLMAYLQGNPFIEAGDLIGPEEIAIYAALGCFEEKSSYELFVQDMDVQVQNIEKKKEKIFQETSGRGHGSVLDQSSFVFCIANLPRLATLQLCQPQYLEHLQQSLRRSNADRGYYLPEAIIQSGKSGKTMEIMDKSFELYEQMKASGIPEEDARFVLPLYTRTSITTKGNARELMHLHAMSREEHMPTAIKGVVEMMMGQLKEVAPLLFKERATNYEVLAWYPSPQLFAPENKTIENLISEYGSSSPTLIQSSRIPFTEEGIKDAVENRDEAELANLKHFHATILAKMSIVTLHQAIRQRTWDQSVESIYSAAERGEITTPPSIKGEWRRKYQRMNNQMLRLYKTLIGAEIPKQEAIGVIPHSVTIYDLIHINGWNAIHSIGKRTCNEAQWEIRGISKKMAGLIKGTNPILGKYCEPQGVLYGRCPEKNNCGYCDAVLQKRKH